jgi:tellurite resistance protein TerC
MEVSLLAWAGFGIAVVLMLAIDLFVFNRNAHTPSFKESCGYTLLWLALGLGLGGLVWLYMGPQSGAEYITAYVLEKSLSVDNLFVFMSLFALFGVLPQYQHRVLFWGVVGAIVMRFIFLFVGTAVLSTFHWLLLPFGLLLVWTAWKIIGSDDDDNEELTEDERKKKADEKASNNKVVQLFKKVFPVTDRPDGEHFFSRHGGKLVATPLFITLIVIECSDLMFAMDSIPAVLGVSRDPFVLITSNVMAILGLRALYFVVNSIMPMFRFLKYGLAFLLAFIGGKMIVEVGADFAHDWGWSSVAEVLGMLHISVTTSLLVVVATLTLSVVLSLIFREKKDDAEPTQEA